MGVQAHLNSLYEGTRRHGEVVVVELVLVFAGICTVGYSSRPAIGIGGDQAIIAKGMGWAPLVAIAVSCTALSQLGAGTVPAGRKYRQGRCGRWMRGCDGVRIDQGPATVDRIKGKVHGLIRDGHAQRPMAGVVSDLAALHRCSKRISQRAPKTVDKIDDPIPQDPFVIMLITRKDDISSPLGKRPLHAHF